MSEKASPLYTNTVVSKQIETKPCQKKEAQKSYKYRPKYTHLPGGQRLGKECPSATLSHGWGEECVGEDGRRR